MQQEHHCNRTKHSAYAMSCRTVQRPAVSHFTGLVRGCPQAHSERSAQCSLSMCCKRQEDTHSKTTPVYRFQVWSRFGATPLVAKDKVWRTYSFDCSSQTYCAVHRHVANVTNNSLAILSACSQYGMQPCYAMAKQLHFNKDGSALKKMQAGVDKLASVVGITLGPKVHFLQHTNSHALHNKAAFCIGQLHAANPACTSSSWSSNQLLNTDAAGAVSHCSPLYKRTATSLFHLPDSFRPCSALSQFTVLHGIV